MNPKNYRAIGIKNSSILIVPNKNFDAIFNVLKVTEDIVEIPVTQEMLDNAEILIPNKPIEIPKIPNFNYINKLNKTI